MAGVKLSTEGSAYLSNIMAELELDLHKRPIALRIAFAKGITSDELPGDQKRKPSNFEFPTSVIAKGDDILLVKHLIIERLNKKIDDKELDKYILQFVEHGLFIMNKEIEQLSSADNYLLYLLEKTSNNIS